MIMSRDHIFKSVLRGSVGQHEVKGETGSCGKVKLSVPRTEACTAGSSTE